ncbi:MAG: tetrahydrodipicolinate N-succinyltransferase N-terminal domain-containing protein, partial [Marinobacter sp.]|uniref:tetrahydrodipicolinate N-succinyltransferase N-terminal domain-containing protein n=1 Tax=Marinobacter sp. TaxID=50741 RepID=UPI00329690F8
MSFAFGIGIGTQNRQGHWLEVYYQQPVMTPDNALMEVVQNALDYKGGNQAISASAEQLSQLAHALRQIGQAEQARLAEAAETSKRPVVVSILEPDDTASSTPEVYLKLHLLSHRMTKPHALKLDGIFGLLPNLAWTSEGAIDLGELPDRQLQARV